MKEQQLREHADCDYCGKKIGEAAIAVFAVVKVTGYRLIPDALQRQQGLGLMIGGPLAMVMGPNEDIAEEAGTQQFTCCADCLQEISWPGEDA